MVFLVVPLSVSTAIAVAVLGTKDLLLEAFAIELQAFRFFAVTSQFFLLDGLLLFVNLRNDYIMGVYRIASLRKRGRRIADRILHGKAFLELLLEGFAKRLGIKGLLVFILELVEVMR